MEVQGKGGDGEKGMADIPLPWRRLLQAAWQPGEECLQTMPASWSHVGFTARIPAVFLGAFTLLWWGLLSAFTLCGLARMQDALVFLVMLSAFWGVALFLLRQTWELVCQPRNRYHILTNRRVLVLQREGAGYRISCFPLHRALIRRIESLGRNGGNIYFRDPLGRRDEEITGCFFLAHVREAAEAITLAAAKAAEPDPAPLPVPRPDMSLLSTAERRQLAAALQPGEILYWIGRPEPSSLTSHWLSFSIGCYLFMVGAAWVERLRIEEGVFAAILLALAVPFMAYGYVCRLLERRSYYALSQQRLFVHGFRRLAAYEAGDVRLLSKKEYGRLADILLAVSPSGETAKEEVLTSLPDADKAAALLETLGRHARAGKEPAPPTANG